MVLDVDPCASGLRLVALVAFARRGLHHTATPTRFVQVGETAGATVVLPAGVLRSSALEIVGSGAGSVPVARIGRLMPEIVKRVVVGEIRAVPLAEAEHGWKDTGAWVVLTP